MFFSPGAPRSPRLDPGFKVELWIGGGGGSGGGEGKSADQQQGEHTIYLERNQTIRGEQTMSCCQVCVAYSLQQTANISIRMIISGDRLCLQPSLKEGEEGH